MGQVGDALWLSGFTPQRMSVIGGRPRLAVSVMSKARVRSSQCFFMPFVRKTRRLPICQIGEFALFVRFATGIRMDGAAVRRLIVKACLQRLSHPIHAKGFEAQVTGSDRFHSTAVYGALDCQFARFEGAWKSECASRSNYASVWRDSVSMQPMPAVV